MSCCRIHPLWRCQPSGALTAQPCRGVAGWSSPRTKLPETGSPQQPGFHAHCCEWPGQQFLRVILRADYDNKIVLEMSLESLSVSIPESVYMNSPKKSCLYSSGCSHAPVGLRCQHRAEKYKSRILESQNQEKTKSCLFRCFSKCCPQTIYFRISWMLPGKPDSWAHPGPTGRLPGT